MKVLFLILFFGACAHTGPAANHPDCARVVHCPGKLKAYWVGGWYDACHCPEK